MRMRLQQSMASSAVSMQWAEPNVGPMNSGMSLALYMLIPELRVKMFERFRGQHSQHEKLTSIRRPSKMVGTLIKRSCWHMVAVEQLVQGFKESNFRWTEEMEGMLLNRTLSCYGTQLIEDVNNVQNNNVSFACRCWQDTRYSKMKTSTDCLCSCIDQRCGGQSSQIQEGFSHQPCCEEDSRSPNDCFETPRNSQSMNFGGIASYTATPPWHSPSTTNVGAPAADLKMVDFVFDKELCCLDSLAAKREVDE